MIEKGLDARPSTNYDPAALHYDAARPFDPHLLLVLFGNLRDAGCLPPHGRIDFVDLLKMDIEGAEQQVYVTAIPLDRAGGRHHRGSACSLSPGMHAKLPCRRARLRS